MKSKLLFLIYITTFSVINSITPVDDENNQVFNLPSERKHSKVNITAELGKTLIIRARGIKTSGYSWYIDNIPHVDYDRVVRPLNLNDEYDTSDFFFDKNESGESQEGGFYYFKFKTLKEGHTTMVFISKKRYDDSGRVIIEVSVTVVNKNTHTEL